MGLHRFFGSGLSSGAINGGIDPAFRKAPHRLPGISCLTNSGPAPCAAASPPAGRKHRRDGGGSAAFAERL